MFTIAICDDNENVRDFIKDCADNFFSEYGSRYTIIFYRSGDELLEKLLAKELTINLLFLDIEMPGTDGIKVKEALEENYLVEKIVFVTSHTETMQLAFGMKVVGFLSKPLDPSLVTGWISNVYKGYSSRKAISFGEKSYKLDDVLYIKSEGNYLLAKLNDGTDSIAIRSDASTIMRNLDSSFIRVHRSYIVNSMHVKKAKYGEISMDNGEVLPVGRKYADEVKSKYEEYVLGKVKGRMGWLN